MAYEMEGRVPSMTYSDTCPLLNGNYLVLGYGQLWNKSLPSSDGNEADSCAVVWSCRGRP